MSKNTKVIISNKKLNYISDDYYGSHKIKLSDISKMYFDVLKF